MESYSSVSDDNLERNEDAQKEDMHVDYVLVFENFDETDGTSTEYRKLFEKMMRDDGLIVTYEYCKKKVSFVKIHCPIDRLCLEAERVRLEMPLKGVSIHFYAKIFRLAFFRVSARNICTCLSLLKLLVRYTSP